MSVPSERAMEVCGENIIFNIQSWLIMIRIQRRRGIWLIGVNTTHMGTGMGNWTQTFYKEICHQ